MTEANPPPGWPGELLLEGRTPFRLPALDSQRRHSLERGPGDKDERAVFYNPAMAASRTRSLLLLANEMESGWLTDSGGPVNALDGLAASGLRSRRWLFELPSNLVQRLAVSAVDIDEESIAWARANHSLLPPPDTVENYSCEVADLTGWVSHGPWNWLDIDPFGSPVHFLEPVIRAAAQRAVLEVSATDTAALTGSSRTALKRRYGARARLDSLKHDTGLRILLATVAKVAAGHGRSIDPLLSIWDGHHLRTSVRVEDQPDSQVKLDSQLGWRMAKPTKEELLAAEEAGLHPNGVEAGQPACLLPIEYEVDAEDPRLSGPLWVGQLGQAEAMAALTQARAVELCAPTPDDACVKEMGLSERDLRLRLRAAARAVRHIESEAVAVHSPTLLVVDDLPKLLSIPSPPSPTKLADALSESSHSAAVAAYGEPAIRTDAPWDEVRAACHRL